MGRQLRLDLQSAIPQTRDDFVVSPANERAVAMLDTWPSSQGGVLALVGPEGSGKSHLASNWAERTGAEFLQDVAADLADLPSLEGRTVAIDDADRVDDETLFHLINQAHMPGGGLLLISRRRPAAWSAELPDLRSRLDAIRVIELGSPDDVVLWGVLDRFFRQRSITPSPDLLEYLVRRIERSVPHAREIVARMAADHRPPTRALARELLEQDGGEND
ncbi:MAG: chromosomal replication initiator DnaA [Proteobacteria bacterium]|nr:chromosomal replication initiator DnaA [Pseudomonadota bacterium]